MAQLIKAPLTGGFVRTSSIEMSVDEMLGARKVRAATEPIVGPGYPALWVSEIQIKPLRFTRMSVVDPATGQANRELVWYMVYRIIPRDYTELAGEGQPDLIRKLQDPENDPANKLDEPVSSIRVPRFVLQTQRDRDSEKAEHVDELNLEIQKAIFAREVARRGGSLKLHNSVEAIGEVPAPVSIRDPDQLATAMYGVAIWRNVDPETDFCSVTMSGLTNAYRISPMADGPEVVEHKVVVQEFSRPGDQFFQEEQEFRVIGEPQWTWRAGSAKLDVPDLDTVLRNAGKPEAGKTSN